MLDFRSHSNPGSLLKYFDYFLPTKVIATFNFNPDYNTKSTYSEISTAHNPAFSDFSESW
jgi:hypothetical protein